MNIHYSGGTTNLNTHLMRHHKIILQPGASKFGGTSSAGTATTKQPSIIGAFGNT